MFNQFLKFAPIGIILDDKFYAIFFIAHRHHFIDQGIRKTPNVSRGGKHCRFRVSCNLIFIQNSPIFARKPPGGFCTNTDYGCNNARPKFHKPDAKNSVHPQQHPQSPHARTAFLLLIPFPCVQSDLPLVVFIL